MTIKEAIVFGKEQLEIFGEDSQMADFIRLALKSLSLDADLVDTKEGYYHLDQLPDHECTVKVKDNAYTCGNCTHLIFKNYHRCTGTCFYTHRIKSFYDKCEVYVGNKGCDMCNSCNSEYEKLRDLFVSIKKKNLYE